MVSNMLIPLLESVNNQQPIAAESGQRAQDGEGQGTHVSLSVASASICTPRSYHRVPPRDIPYATCHSCALPFHCACTCRRILTYGQCGHSRQSIARAYRTRDCRFPALHCDTCRHSHRTLCKAPIRYALHSGTFHATISTPIIRYSFGEMYQCNTPQSLHFAGWSSRWPDDQDGTR